MKKIDLVKQISKSMYDSKFSNKDEKSLKVITKEYLNTVLYNVYNDNSQTNEYSIIAGDFNEINDLNKIYGFEETDKCIKESLEIIYDILPKDSIICRNGGDEFLFILPNEQDKEKVNSYINNIHKTLNEKSSDLHNIQISLFPAYSNEGNSLEDLYVKADKKVDESKIQRKIKENKLYSAYSTFYSALRLSDNYKFHNKRVSNLIDLAINATIDMLKNYKETGIVLDEENTLDNRTQNVISKEDAIKINDYFIKNDISNEDELENISTLTLMKISKALVYDANIGAFTKEYYENYLRDNLLYDKYKVSILSLSGLKLANLIYGHNCVDKYLNENIYQNVKDNIDSVLPICNTLFTSTGDCYKISLRGGDILFIEHPESDYKEKPEFYDKNITTIRNEDDPKEILAFILQYVKISSTKPIEKENIMDFVEFVKDDTRIKKDELKTALLNRNISLKIAKKCLEQDLKLYCKLNPDDYMNSEKVRNFIKAECEAMLEHEPIITKQLNNNKFSKDDYDMNITYPISDEKDVNDKIDR